MTIHTAESLQPRMGKHIVGLVAAIAVILASCTMPDGTVYTFTYDAAVTATPTIFSGAQSTSAFGQATPIPSPPAETPEPESGSNTLSAAEILHRARAADDQVQSASVEVLSETTSPGDSFTLTCDGVTELPQRYYLLCEILDTKYEVITLGETDAYLRLLDTVLWMKPPAEDLELPGQQTGLDAFGDDVTLVGEETVRGVDSYIIESEMDLTDVFASDPELAMFIGPQDVSAPMRAWIGKEDYRMRRAEIVVSIATEFLETENRTVVEMEDFDAPVQIPDPEPYATLQSLTAIGPIGRIAFSPDSSALAAGIDGGAIYLWSMRDPELNTRVFLQDLPSRHSGEWSGYHPVAFSSGGDILAAGAVGMVHVYSLTDPDREPLLLATGSDSNVDALVFSPDGRFLAGGGGDNAIHLWRMHDPENAHVVLDGHEDDIMDLEFLPGGETLISSSRDGSIRLWNMKRLGDEPRVLTGHKMPVYELALTPQGDRLLSAGFDEPVYAWSLARPDNPPEVMLPAMMPEFGKASTLAMALSPDQQVLATADDAGMLWLWAAPDFDESYAAFFSGEMAIVSELSFSPDGRYLAAGTDNYVVHLWDLAPNTPAEPLHDLTILDGLTATDVLSRSHDALAALETLQLTMTLEYMDEWIEEETPDEPMRMIMLTASVDMPGDMHGWLDEDFADTQELVQRDGGPIYGRFGPHDEWAQLVGPSSVENMLQQGPFSLGNPTILANQAQFASQDAGIDALGDVYTISFAVRPRQLVEIAPDAGMLFGTEWTNASGQAWIGRDDFLPRRVQYEINFISPDDSRTLTYVVDLGAFGQPVEIPDFGETIDSEDVREPETTLDPGGGFGAETDVEYIGIPEPEPAVDHIPIMAANRVTDVAFSPDGETLAASTNDGEIFLFSAYDPELLTCIIEHPEWKTYADHVRFWSLAFSSDGTSLAAGTPSKVLLFSMSDPKAWPPSFEIDEEETAEAVAISPDGSWLAAGTDEGLIYVWSLDDEEGEPLLLEGHAGVITGLHFLSNEQTLASSSEDATIRLWNLLDTEVPPQVLAGHKWSVEGLEVSTRADTLLSVGGSDPVYVWLLNDEPVEPKALIPPDLSGVAKPLAFALAMSPDGKLLATAHAEGIVYVWTVPQFNRPYTTFTGEEPRYRPSLDFSVDGRFLAIADGHNEVQILDLAPDTPDELFEDPTTVDGMTAREILTRSQEAMTNLQMARVSTAIDKAVFGTYSREQTMPTQTITATSEIRLPGDAHGWVYAPIVGAREYLHLEGGEVYGRRGPDEEWQLWSESNAPQHVPQQDLLALLTTAPFARQPYFVEIHEDTNSGANEAYVVAFAVRPRAFLEVAPQHVAETSRERISGQVWIGKEDFLPQKAQYQVEYRVAGSDLIVTYTLEPIAFDEPITMPDPPQ